MVARYISAKFHQHRTSGLKNGGRLHSQTLDIHKPRKGEQNRVYIVKIHCLEAFSGLCECVKRLFRSPECIKIEKKTACSVDSKSLHERENSFFFSLRHA